VKRHLAPFVAGRLDATDDDDKAMQATLARYGVAGLPAILFYDSAGHETARYTEFLAPEKLIRAADEAFRAGR
jgi:thioredoxin:protein disulfide reductase